MQVVLAVLNLLYVFSKRSNYITRLGSDKRSPLLSRLQHLAEVRGWGSPPTFFGVSLNVPWMFWLSFVFFCHLCRVGVEKRMDLGWLSAVGTSTCW